MRRGLELRVRALEAAVPAEDEARESPFPQWLLDARQEAGLQFDRSDGDSLRQTVRVGPAPRASRTSRVALGRYLPIRPRAVSETLRPLQLRVKARVFIAGAFSIQGLEVSCFGSPTLWILNRDDSGGMGGNGFCGINFRVTER
jgi:hypothetical protein